MALTPQQIAVLMSMQGQVSKRPFMLLLADKAENFEYQTVVIV